jgi:type I restriction enzyme S subunit
MAEPVPKKEIGGAYELPDGWVWAKLPEISEIIMGQSPPSSTYNTDKKGLPFFQGKAEFGELYPKPIKWCIEPKKVAQKNDILISVRAPVGPTNICPEESCIGRGLAAIRPKTGIPTMFIIYFLRVIEKELALSGTGSTFEAISKKDIVNIPIPLPPLAEQHRIVAKLEALLAQVNAAKDHLAVVPLLIKRFRQSVLAAACSGRLTKDWRREHLDVEPARKLIEGILQRRLIQANTPTKKQKIKDIYSHREEPDSDLLPRSWEYVTLGKLCESFQYGSSKKSMPEGKIPVLRMGNIQNGEIDWNNLVYTSDEWEMEKYSLEPGTALFNRTNSPKLVGKTAIYRGERPAIFAGYLIKINNYKELNSEYLNYCLNTTYTKEQCLKVRTDGVSQSNINAQKLGKFKIPFCPLEEQEEIVRQIDALFKAINSIEYHYKKANAQIDNLTQSILAKAFRGELVPQDPDDEPASVLLERIRKERTELKKKKKPQKRRPKNLPDFN